MVPLHAWLMDFDAWIREQLDRPGGSPAPLPSKRRFPRRPAMLLRAAQAILGAGALGVIAIGLAAPGQLPNLTLPLASARQPGLPVSTLAGGPRSGSDDASPGHTSGKDSAAPSSHISPSSSASSDASHGHDEAGSGTGVPSPAPAPSPSDDGGHGGRPRDQATPSPSSS